MDDHNHANQLVVCVYVCVPILVAQTQPLAAIRLSAPHEGDTQLTGADAHQARFYCSTATSGVTSSQ